MRCFIAAVVACCFISPAVAEEAPALKDPAPNGSPAPASAELLKQREAQLAALQREVAELREKLGVDDELVCVSAKIYELSHNALRAQGVDVSRGALASYLPPPVLAKSEPAARQTLPIWIASDVDDAVLKQLATWVADPTKPAKLLASPQLITPLGKAAFVNIGGEFPIVVPQSLGTTTIEFRRYGTQLDATATKTPEGNIELRVRPRVSRLDSARSVTLNGQQVPGLEVRECDLAVTLRPAQMLVVSGLVQSRTTTPKPTGRRGAAQPTVHDQIEAVMVISVDFVKPEATTNATAVKPDATSAR